VITPTSKHDVHDELLSADQIVKGGFMTSEDWEQASALALKLFAIGQTAAGKSGLILVDTKYEFGKDEEGRILLVDEVWYSSCTSIQL